MYKKLIIFPFGDQKWDKTEYTVITKVPLFVFGNTPFAYSYRLFKSIRPEHLTTGYDKDT